MRLLPTGIYTPLPCFFDENEDLGKYSIHSKTTLLTQQADLDSFKKHVKCELRSTATMVALPC
jgi:hypothetical protein